MIRAILVSSPVLCLAPAVLAEDFRLAWPVECVLGVDCTIQQYVDRDASDGVLDFSCGTLTYDGHKGTDIRVPTLTAMEDGMAVLAARAGTVIGVRDGMPDVDISGETAIDVSGRECGNGVVLSHGGGWETQYCHLRQSSVQVRDGDYVSQGAYLGDIGMSGNAAFPHLHFSVRRNGDVVDPFAPEATSDCTDQAVGQLWLQPVPYVPTGLLDFGFSTEVPAYASVKQGMPEHSRMPRDIPALVLWVAYYGPRVGDRIDFRMKGPNGFTFEHEFTVERDQAQAMRAAGRRAPPGGWPPGDYAATVTYFRDTAPVWSAERRVEILP